MGLFYTAPEPTRGPLSGTTQVSRYQKGKTNLGFTEARDSEWQWHQLGHMQVWTSLQTANHASTSLLKFLQAGCPSCHPTNSVKALKKEAGYPLKQYSFTEVWLYNKMFYGYNRPTCVSRHCQLKTGGLCWSNFLTVYVPCWHFFSCPRDLRVGHTMDVLSPFISVFCHSDWLFHGESCQCLDVVQPGHAWSSSPVFTYFIFW